MSHSPLLPFLSPRAGETEERMAIKGQFDSAHIMSAVPKQDALGWTPDESVLKTTSVSNTLIKTTAKHIHTHINSVQRAQPVLKPTDQMFCT